MRLNYDTFTGRRSVFVGVAAALILLLFPLACPAEGGITLHTVSCFAGTDTAAEEIKSRQPKKKQIRRLRYIRGRFSLLKDFIRIS